MPKAVLAELQADFDLGYHDSEAAVSRETLLKEVAGVDGCVLTLSDRVDDAFLEAAGEPLRVVANYAVGFDNVDVAAATQRRVVVTNTPDVLTNSTADLALALMLSLVRRVTAGDRFLRRREAWTWAPTMMLGASLEDQLLGVVGFGRIGQALARRASCLGMRVVFSDSIERDAPGFEQVALPTLIERSDVISLHCPLLPETHHLIGPDELGAMKSTAVLINTSRGAVIDEAALCAALHDGAIAGAGLDVFEHEPAVTEELLELDNVVLAPHLGSATHQARNAMGGLCASALRAVLIEDRMPPNAVNGRELG